MRESLVLLGFSHWHAACLHPQSIEASAAVRGLVGVLPCCLPWALRRRPSMPSSALMSSKSSPAATQAQIRPASARTPAAARSISLANSSRLASVSSSAGSASSGGRADIAADHERAAGSAEPVADLGLGDRGPDQPLRRAEGSVRRRSTATADGKITKSGIRRVRSAPAAPISAQADDVFGKLDKQWRRLASASTRCRIGAEGRQGHHHRHRPTERIGEQLGAEQFRSADRRRWTARFRQLGRPTATARSRPSTHLCRRLQGNR